jgi:hypothetical protein
VRLQSVFGLRGATSNPKDSPEEVFVITAQPPIASILTISSCSAPEGWLVGLAASPTAVAAGRHLVAMCGRAVLAGGRETGGFSISAYYCRGGGFLRFPAELEGTCLFAAALQV